MASSTASLVSGVVNLLSAEWNPVTNPAVQIAVFDDNATAAVVHFLMTLPYRISFPYIQLLILQTFQ